MLIFAETFLIPNKEQKSDHNFLTGKFGELYPIFESAFLGDNPWEYYINNPFSNISGLLRKPIAFFSSKNCLDVICGTTDLVYTL